MRVCFVHNPTAGSSMPVDQLRHLIERAGHRIVQFHERRGGELPLFDADAEFVVAAGGDGTVAAVAERLAGSAVPLAILPLGTANNIAASLGIVGRIEPLIRSWSTARPLPLDLGIARGPFGERSFIESVGAGLIAEGIVSIDGVEPAAPTMSRLPLGEGRARFAAVLAGLTPRHCEVTIDGVSTTMEMLLLEILNVGAAGPALRLARAADPCDGLLDVLAIDASWRRDLARYLHDGQSELPLPTRRAREVVVAGVDRVHVDDWTCALDGTPVTVGARRAALRVLAPPDTPAAGALPQGRQ
jgi:diacylglycerol kinase family enzyme